MLILLSPAKSLSYDLDVPASVSQTTPLFIEQAQKLMQDLRKLSQPQIASLMKLSDKLASLNVTRFQEWTPDHDVDNAHPAVYLFDGDVYKGLNIGEIEDKHLLTLNEHLLLLSGLYGVLRPFDRILPYRLEMGTKLDNFAGANLYAVWKDITANYLNHRLEKLPAEKQVIFNLASNEYFKSVDKKQLNYPVISPEFKDYKNGQYKIISFFAKRARGLMARYLVEHGCQPGTLNSFNVDGYQYNPELSTDSAPVFTRRQD